MKQRLSDQPNLSQRSDAPPAPFVERHPLLDPWKVAGALGLGLLLCVGLLYDAGGGDAGIAIVLLVLVFVILITYVAYTVHRARTIILASEFQNALYAGANNAGVEFSMICDLSGRVVYTSPGCKRFVGDSVRSNRDSLEQAMLALGIEDMDRIHFLSAFKANTRTSRSVQVRDAFGLLQDLFIVCRPIIRPRGYYLFKAIRLDQEERQKQPLKTNPALTALLNALPFPAYLASDDGALLYTNPAFDELLGYSPGGLLEQHATIEDIVASPDTEQLRGYFEGLIPFHHAASEHPVRARLYQCVLEQQSDNPHREQPSLLCGYIPPQQRGGFAATTTESSHDPGDIDAAMAEVWLSALKQAPISIVFFDSNGVITQSNQAFSKLAGQSVSAGQSILDIMDSSQHAMFKDQMEQQRYAAFSDESIAIDIQLKHPSDSEKAALIYLSSLGRHGFIGHLVDTTQQKRFEQRMVQSQKMQAVGQLAGGIAHDFNNLLTAMIAFCDLLLIRHPAGDPSFPDIMQVKQNANRAANLVRQLLAFSRKQTLQPEIIDISDALADLSNLIRRLIGDHIELDIVHGRNLPQVKVDKVQLEQVIINLAVNARDAMKEGGELIIQTRQAQITGGAPAEDGYIAASDDDALVDGTYTLIEVIDTGEGIEPDIVQRIFDPFFSTKETGAGTGLGLATVYGIIKQTGGSIYVRTRLDEGTTFQVYLPQVSEKDVAEAQSNKKAKEESEKDLTGKGTILLVEDEAPVRMFSVRALKNKGYEVFEAENGEEGLSVWQEHADDIDIIVTDVMMPGMDGPSMIKKIHETRPDLQVIFISGYGEDAFIKTYGTERTFNFLPKPYSLKELAAKIKDVMA